jgi:multiple sugar transport system permease protein
VVALFISVLLSKKIAGHKIFQVIYFIPYICSSVAVSLMWMWMFDPDYGIINSIIEFIAGPGARIAWFKDKNWYPWMIIIATVWQAPGYGIVLYKAALDQVNPSLYEASSIDGASAWRKFWNITLPSIAPTTFFLLMAGIMSGLQTFDMAKLFAQTGNTWLGESGPENSGLTTVLYIYNWGTNYQNMPRASVMSWVLFYIIFIISALNFKLRRKWVDE